MLDSAFGREEALVQAEIDEQNRPAKSWRLRRLTMLVRKPTHSMKSKADNEGTGVAVAVDGSCVRATELEIYFSALLHLVHMNT